MAAKRINKKIPMGEEAQKLTIKQQLFIDAYFMNGFNAKEAAITAGFKPDYAKQQGYMLTTKPHIKKAIEERRDQLRESLKISPEYLLQKLKKAIETSENESLQNHLRAIEMAMKHNGMFSEKVEVTGKDGEALKIEQQQKTKAEADAFTGTILGLVGRADKKK